MNAFTESLSSIPIAETEIISGLAKLLPRHQRHTQEARITCAQLRESVVNFQQAAKNDIKILEDHLTELIIAQKKYEKVEENHKMYKEIEDRRENLNSKKSLVLWQDKAKPGKGRQ